MGIWQLFKRMKERVVPEKEEEQDCPTCRFRESKGEKHTNNWCNYFNASLAETCVLIHPGPCGHWQSKKKGEKALRSREEKQVSSIMARAIGSTTKEVEKVAEIVKETNEALDMGLRKKPITIEEVIKLIDEYDSKPDRTQQDFYINHMKIVLGNEMINLETWDNIYTQADRNTAYKKAEAIQVEALKKIEERKK